MPSPWAMACWMQGTELEPWRGCNMKDSRNIIIRYPCFTMPPMWHCHTLYILSRMHGFPELSSGILGCNCLSLGCMPERQIWLPSFFFSKLVFVWTSSVPLETFTVIESDLPSFPSLAKNPQKANPVWYELHCWYEYGSDVQKGDHVGVLSGALFFF